MGICDLLLIEAYWYSSPAYSVPNAAFPLGQLFGGLSYPEKYRYCPVPMQLYGDYC